ncbi:uncharacterized protein [Periplaneta americana]|uniref:uncharacterized protein n=1 Tax=Periplaneta americana TaxID=6978 RepID=UPI0037E82AA1
MKGFLSTLLVCLVASLATAIPQCDLGKQTVDKLDSKMFSGTWKAKYLMPVSFSQGKGRCWAVHFTPSGDGNFQARVSIKSPKSGKTISLMGSMKIVEDRILKATFNENPAATELAGLSGNYSVVAFDEGKGYLMIGGCPALNNNKPAVWVSYRQYPPSEDSLKASEAAIKETGLKLEDFDENCE